jgi:hypothetical protein
MYEVAYYRDMYKKQVWQCMQKRNIEARSSNLAAVEKL